MKTYKELVRDLEEINELEEGKLAKALAVAALGLGLYGAAKPPMDMDKIHGRGPTPAAHVMKSDNPNSPRLDAPDIKGKATGLARLLSGVAERRRKKKGAKDKGEEQSGPREPESPLPYIDHEDIPHLNPNIHFD